MINVHSKLHILYDCVALLLVIQRIKLASHKDAPKIWDPI